MLSISVAEMRALEELPERDKDSILPYFQLRPWGASHELEKTLNRLSDAYADRPFLSDISAPSVLDGEPRPVHRQLDALRRPAGAYANWCDFLEDQPSMIPTVQLGDVASLAQQAERLARLQRGLGVYLPAPAFGRATDIGRVVGDVTDGGTEVIVILDLGQRGRDLLGAQAQSAGLVRSLRDHLPSAAISISASSFPGDFVGLNDQEIFERQHFNGVRDVVRGNLIYSDRGSARAQKQMGGGGTPAPRVDLAGAAQWSFFRDGTGGDRAAGYEKQAQDAMESDAWDGDLRVWGVQLVERTAGGDRHAIKSPASAAAARINMHLHQQLYFGDADGLYETDEEWQD